MATADELDRIAEAGRAVVREGLADGTIPPFSDEQVAMLRDAGCPSAMPRMKAAS